ncbi:adhesion G-protein coupled receptor G4 isoform X2 [Hyla sarda]|uniref:adhesion G-protein coupled receptor G4 isoform X2 n=1 Tax=Hyla sarda TaxID=327740 RepID=UPI0024C30AEC|nr:adhesion G-protein coupled receptor G4 isoform X2 [Hyla sarda]
MNVNGIKMKDPGTSRCLLNILLMLILTIDLQTSTGTSSFWKKKANVFSKKTVGEVQYTEIPALSELTVCLDVFYENDAQSTAWSYCGQDGVNPELGFGRKENTLEVFHMGTVYAIKATLKQNIWYTVCLKWKRKTMQLKVYVNGTRIYNTTTTEDRMLKSNGSLVLGATHTNKGEIVVMDKTIMTGKLYNYQMWNYTRSDEELLGCNEGNLISWTKETWNFDRTLEDVQLRCANASVIPTPEASTTTPTPTLGTTSTRASTPSPENSVTTETLPAATSGTITPSILSTSVTQKETTSSSTSDNLTSAQLPNTMPTSTSAQPKFSTTAATTETLSGSDLLTNSSVDLPTGNNVSTTGNISSTYHSPPGLRTTSAVPITSWNSTSIHQESPEGKTTPDPQVVSTKAPIISTQPDIMSKPMTGTTLQTTTTSPPTKSATPSTVTNVSSAFSSSSSPSTVTNVSSAFSSSSSPSTVTNVSSAFSSSSSPSTVTNVSSAFSSSSSPSTITNVSGAFSSSSSPSTVTNVSSAFSSSSSPSTVNTSSSSLSTSPHITLSGVTESPVSHSETTYFPSTNSTILLPANVVTFYVVQIKFISRSTQLMDEHMALSLIQNTMNQLLNNTEFAAVQIIVFKTESNDPGNVHTQNNYKKKRETNEDSNPQGYIAKSIVRANSSQNTAALAVELGSLLMEGFDAQQNHSLIAKNVTSLAAEYCRSESTSYDDFPYEWPETNATEKASLHCHKNLNSMATRECYINVTTLTTEWGDPNYAKCVPSSFEDLENFTVTPENANYLAMQILNMTKKADSLPDEDIRIILNKVSEIIALGEIDLETAKVHVDVINFVLQKGNTTLRLFANKILNLMEEVGFKINFTGETANVTANSMALLVSKKFKEIYFTVTTYLEGNVEITFEQFPPDNAVAFIHLPKSIQDQAEISSAKVQFNFIGHLSPFQDYESRFLELNTYIISASFEGINVDNLMEPIDITLRHVKENVEDYPVKCAFWDFTKKSTDNLGGWNTSGCSVTFTNKEYTSCSCNHLTHFGVLLDLSGAQINSLDEHILSLLTYVGCGIASLFLGVALVTYGMFRQLRRDYPSKILMNLSFSLLMLNLLFLVNNWLSLFRNQGLCISVAALLHYFLLTSFTWMGLEAVHMYFAFVKVFNAYVHKYILKLCIAGWGIPLVVVVAVLCVNVNFYGVIMDNRQHDVPGDSDASFCWIQNDIVFYVAVVSYFGVIFLINISMFIVVLLQIKSLKSTRIKDWKSLFLHDIKNTLSLAFLLGLTWGFAFFAWGPVRVAFLYLFAIFNTLQGFFIFVFHCLIKENVRRQWKMYLCCGRCRLDNYSDWSRLSNAETRYNGRIHLSPSDSYQSTRSNNTASTSNTSSLSSLSRDAFYGNSYVNGGGIFISSAYIAPSHHASAYPNNNRKLTFLD